MPGQVGRAKYALDTNLFIPGMRTALAATRLAEFHAFFAPFEYLSAIVVQELRAGLRTPAAAKRFDAAIVDPISAARTPCYPFVFRLADVRRSAFDSSGRGSSDRFDHSDRFRSNVGVPLRRLGKRLSAALRIVIGGPFVANSPFARTQRVRRLVSERA